MKDQMGKIIFVNPPSMDSAYAELREFALAVPPLGMAYIAAYLESYNNDVEIVDCDALRLDIPQAVNLIKNKHPKYIGLMAMTSTMTIVTKMFKLLRVSLPDAILVLGGVHGTALPKRTLEEVPEIDFIVMGEGEYTTHELITKYENNETSLEDLKSIKGIGFRHDNSIYINERRPLIDDLDSLPFPARHLLPMEVYNGPGWFRWFKGYVKPFVSVFTTRGCPFNCNFCASHLMSERKVRQRSIENVMAEIDHLVETYNIKVLCFQDDTFTMNRKRTIELCTQLSSRDYDLRIMCSTRVNQVDEELLMYMKKAGVEWMFYGVESGNEEVLKRCNKRITLSQIRRAYDITRKAGICTHAGIILGHIGETKETALDSIRFLRDLNSDYAAIATLVPFPGSYAWDYCQENKIPLPKDWCDFGMVNSMPIAVNPGLSSADLLILRDKGIFSYNANPNRLLRMFTDKRYNKKLMIYDHFYNAYALLLRKIRLTREVLVNS